MLGLPVPLLGQKLTQPDSLTVAALPGGVGCHWPGPESHLPCRLPGVHMLLPAGPHGADQAARLMLRNLDGGGGWAPLLVSVLCTGEASLWPGHPLCPCVWLVSV